MTLLRPDPQGYLVQLLEQMPVGFLRLGDEGAIGSANPAACELLGLPESELQGRIFAGLFADEEAVAGAVRAVAAGAAMETILTQRGPQESPAHLQIHLQPFDVGGVGGMIAVLQDVTESVSVRRERAEILAQVELMAETSARLGSSIDPDEVFTQLADSVVPFLGDWCVLDLIEPGGVSRVGVRHNRSEMEEVCDALLAFRPDASHPQHPVVRTLLKERPVVISDIDEGKLHEIAYEDEHRAILRSLGIRSLMVIPLNARGRLLGALTLVSGTNPKRYGATQLVMGLDISARAALALDNSRLLSEHVDLARRLQASLLPPSLPQIPGLDVAARYHPATSGIDVGGDFYDIFKTGNKSWNFVIGDVSGKGATAAVVTTLARYTVRAAAMQARAPRRILGIVSEAIYDQTPSERFVTGVFARIRTDGGPGAKRLTVACGGHPLPVVLRVDGTVEEVGTPGSALGVMTRVTIRDHSSLLQPGDALVLYTDGVIEAGDSGSMLGAEGLAEALRGCRGLAAGSIADRVIEVAQQQRSGEPRDDMAMVVVKVPAGETG